VRPIEETPVTQQLAPQPTPRRRGRRIGLAALRVLALLAALVGTRVVVAAALDGLGLPDLVTGLLTAAAVLAAYVGAVRAVEKRRPSEVSAAGSGRELLLGSLLGTGAVCVVIGLLAALGMYTVDGTQAIGVLGVALGSAVMAGTVEELALRGVVFRLLEQRFGTWTALAASAALFGGLHLVNPGATLVSAAAIALEAGVALGLAYVATRRLWVPIGLHVAWNAVEGGVFGSPTSGQLIDGVLVSRLSGPAWVSGGDFGIEGSALTVAVFLVVSGFFLRSARRTGRMVPVRRRRSA
jgi:membrane protease YdiL (CAAX protease family)